MIIRKDIFIENLQDYRKLDEIIDATYIDEDLSTNLMQYFKLSCKKITYEYPYYDRDYLSTYYNFYATKLKEYSKKCVRLIIWGEDEELLGYITLRPTPTNTKLGKTYLEPMFLINVHEGVSCNIILSNHKAHIFDQDITVCAHIAVWALLRHFSSKSALYAELLSGDIADSVEYYARKIPSPGLTPPQMSTLLMKSGFSTALYTSNDYITLQNEIIAYLDSGIPLIGVISKYAHAISIIGYTIDKTSVVDKLKDGYIFREPDFVRSGVGSNIILHSRLIKGLVVNDDMSFPYTIINRYSDSLERSSEEDANNHQKYLPRDIDCIIVPFYKRVLMSYSEAYQIFMALNKDDEFHWIEETSSDDNIYVRLFLAPSNKLKEFANDNWERVGYIVENFVAIEMPKYVWCVEISSTQNYVNDMVDSFIVIDSTATATSNPCLFIRDKDKYRLCIESVANRNESKEVHFIDQNEQYIPIKPFHHFDKNYERVQ